MTDFEITDAVASLQSLMPRTSPEQANLLTHILKEDRAFSRKVVLAEIKTHATRNTFFQPPVLRQSILRAHERRQDQLKAFVKQRLVDWLRIQDRTERFRNLSDEQVLLMHFSDSWGEVMQRSLDEATVKDIRAMLMGHAKIAFTEIGKDDEQAAQFAATAIDGVAA